MTIAVEGPTPEVPSSSPPPPAPHSPLAEERGPADPEIGSKGLKFGPRSLVPAVCPLGSGWSGGVGRCLPQGQTPLGEGCWFRPVPADWPGVGAVRTLPGGYLPAEHRGLGACVPQTRVKWESASLLFPCLRCSLTPLDRVVMSVKSFRSIDSFRFQPCGS